MSEEEEQALHRKVTELCDRGDALVEGGELDQAVALYEEALSLLPRPLYRWHAATWILTALGETLYFQGQHREAVSALNEALQCPRGLGNPLIHLRLGQAGHALGDESLAREHLGRALLAGAEDVFQGEEPHYLEIAREGARTRQASVRLPDASGDGEGSKES